MSTTERDIFEVNRLAVSLVEAAQADDEQQVLAVLAAVSEPEIGPFLQALAGMIPHALQADPAAGLPVFLAAYRQLIDQAEQLVRGDGPATL